MSRDKTIKNLLESARSCADQESAELLDIAKQILAFHAEAESAVARGLEKALAAGDLLLAAKARLEHGAWTPWLEKNCPRVKPRTARMYMQLARGKAAVLDKNGNVAVLSLAKAAHIISRAEFDAEAAEFQKELKWFADTWEVLTAPGSSPAASSCSASAEEEAAELRMDNLKARALDILRHLQKVGERVHCETPDERADCPTPEAVAREIASPDERDSVCEAIAFAEQLKKALEARA